MPKSLEIEFQDSTLKATAATLQGTLTLVILLLNIGLGFALIVADEGRRADIIFACISFQLSMLVAIGLTRLKGKLRRHSAFATPVFFIVGLALWMIYYVMNVNEINRHHAHGFAVCIIFAAYAFEKQNPVVGICGGVGASLTYLFLRYRYGLLGHELLPQIVAGLVTTNALGYYVCLTNAKSDRKKFILTRDLEAERILSDDLLHKILPAEIAPALRSGRSFSAESFASVSIVFADLVGFTALASSIPPNQLVSILNDIFSKFDRLAERYGVEKIKTIGDGYMAVAGCPKLLSDHAPRTAAFALAIRKSLQEFNRTNNLQLSLRIGIHSGQVVAGVIGEKRFGYDIWGDAVNIASRMESSAEPGMIQISSVTAELIKDHFVISELKSVSIKGKGEFLVCQLHAEHPKHPYSPLPVETGKLAA